MTEQWKPRAHINVREKQPARSIATLWWEFRPSDKMSFGSAEQLGVPVLLRSPLRPAPFSSPYLAAPPSCSSCARGQSIPLPPGGWAAASEEGLKASREGWWLGPHGAACRSSLLRARGPSHVVGLVSCIPLALGVDCKCFLFLSYVSRCYGIVMPLATKTINDVFSVVTNGVLCTIQRFIL